MKSFKLLGFSLFLGTIAILSQLVSTVNAQGVEDFVFESFNATYELTNKDPQGELTITEDIVLNYSSQNRGILRAIPSTYKDNELNVQVISVIRDDKKEEFATYEDNGNEVIRIRNVDTYITGRHSYQIRYKVENVISFYDDYDELFWDINGDQWSQTFSDVSVSLITDAPGDDETGYACYTGSFGEVNQDCNMSVNDSVLSTKTTRPLLANETLTIVRAYKKGYFTPMTWLERNEKLIAAIPALILQIGAVCWAYKRWDRFGRDPKKRGVVAPYFERPRGVSVMQASYIANNKLTPQHISANIIDLAIRGFLRIEETKNGKKTKHNLTLLKIIDATVSEDEEVLLKALFTNLEINSSVKLEDKKNKLYKTAQELSKMLDSATADKGYYELSPKKAVGKIVGPLVLGGVALLIGFIFVDSTKGLSAMGGVIGMGIIGTFAALMSKRSQSGNMLVEHMEGLKLYLGFSEKERIKMQDAVAAPLASHSGQPVRDVKFFEKLLPYAVANGVEKSWANAFKDIYSEPPDWYQGNWNTFSTAALASSLADTTKVAGTSFTAPSSSGSSGSGGGGFSGGGGGGGGGGGW